MGKVHRRFGAGAVCIGGSALELMAQRDFLDEDHEAHQQEQGCHNLQLQHWAPAAWDTGSTSCEATCWMTEG